MKKKTALIAFAALLLAASTFYLQDGWLYWFYLGMATAVLGSIQFMPRFMLKMTRWSKAKPIQAQAYIAGIQLLIMGIGLFAGYNLKGLDFQITNTAAYVFSAVTMAGFLSVHFWPKRGEQMVLPRELDRQRLSYLSIALSSLMMMVFIGNRVADMYPDSILSNSLENLDQRIFSKIIEDPEPSDALGELESGPAYSLALGGGVLALPSGDVPPVKALDKAHYTEKTSLSKAEKKEAKKIQRAEKRAERKEKRMTRRQIFRLATAGGLCALGIFLFILLIAPLCAGICLLGFAFSGEASAGYAVLGILLTAGSIWGMVASLRMCRKDKPDNKKTNLDKDGS